MVLSFWAKASSSGAKIFFRWGFVSEYRSVSLTDSWRYYTVRMDRTKDNNNVIHPYVNAAGTVWLSELQLENGIAATMFAEENGGNYGTLTVKNGGKYSGLTSPTRGGYEFKGWYTKPAGGELITADQTALKANVKLFALWEQLDHSHSYAAAEVKPASCTEGRYTIYKCSCGSSYKGSAISVLGHEYSNGECTRCGAKDPDYTTPALISFTDVKEGAFYYDAVYWAVENGITKGMSETSFCPNEVCTRGQVVAFLWRANGSPIVSVNAGFTDVKAGAFYYDAVEWAVANKITNGMTKTEFWPQETCTRGHVVTFLYRAQ